MRQTILHSITNIMAAVVDVMDMEKDKDRAGDSISRTLMVRRPRFLESNNYKSLNASTERGGYSEMRALPGQKTIQEFQRLFRWGTESPSRTGVASETGALPRKKQFKNSKVRFGGTPKPARETRALPEQKMAA